MLNCFTKIELELELDINKIPEIEKGNSPENYRCPF